MVTTSSTRDAAFFQDRSNTTFKYSSSNYLDILDALISQQNLERQILTARRTVIEYRVDLAKALAGSWDMKAPERRQLSSSNTNGEPSKKTQKDQHQSS